jgi:hypothetical protein
LRPSRTLTARVSSSLTPTTKIWFCRGKEASD